MKLAKLKRDETVEDAKGDEELKKAFLSDFYKSVSTERSWLKITFKNLTMECYISDFIKIQYLAKYQM